ncbi:hypothetical protein HYV91_03500 [Candidatus Wolfebacteria bacterium]|nr:hypothetical protein [Candidatus Wolfebacteria bacterium]
MIPRNVIKDLKLLASFGAAIFALFLGFVFVYIHFADFNGLVIIHFDSREGIDFLGSVKDVFGILASAFIMIVVNLFLSNFLYYRERFLAYVFAFVSLALAILILIAISVIVSIN